VSITTGQPPGLLALLRVQGRVIAALILRELMTRFGRRGGGFIWIFIEPAAFMLVIGGLRYLWRGNARHDLPILVFAFASMLPFLMFRRILMRATDAVNANRSLLYHRQVTVLDVVLARNVLEIGVTVTIALIGLTLCGIYLGEWPDNPVLWIVALVLSALLANGLGLLLGALGAISAFSRFLVRPIVIMLMPISGAMWMLQDTTPDFRAGALWIPMVSLHEAMREAQFGPRVQSYYDLGYVCLWVLGTTLLGLVAVKAVRRMLDRD
jgi:capsular polysaccharide transport system permease protein